MNMNKILDYSVWQYYLLGNACHYKSKYCVVPDTEAIISVDTFSNREHGIIIVLLTTIVPFMEARLSVCNTFLELRSIT